MDFASFPFLGWPACTQTAYCENMENMLAIYANPKQNRTQKSTQNAQHDYNTKFAWLIPIHLAMQLCYVKLWWDKEWWKPCRNWKQIPALWRIITIGPRKTKNTSDNSYVTSVMWIRQFVVALPLSHCCFKVCSSMVQEYIREADSNTRKSVEENWKNNSRQTE